VVLPTIRKNHSIQCLPVLRPFEKRVRLGRAPHPGHFLVHVRSMAGKAVNRVIYVGR
jgi:hypothetical protein